MNVYQLFAAEDAGANERYEVGFDMLDGDFMQVGPEGLEYTFGKGRDATVRLPDGGFVSAYEKNLGVRIEVFTCSRSV